MAVFHPKKTKPVVEKKAQDRVAKPSLDREALADIVDLALRAGQLLMENGSESQRVEETIRTLGTSLGCDWGDVLVSHNAIVVSYSSRGEFRTKIRRVSRGGVNMSLIEEISHLTHRVEEGKFDNTKIRAELARISTYPRHYNRWFTVIAVGLACAAFSRLFGGDWPVFGVTWGAASIAMFIRQEFTLRHFNSMLVVIASAFVAGGMVGVIYGLTMFSRQVGLALAASVLFLVPGVPFINAVEDLIKGYTVVGLARGATSALIILAIALGLLTAMCLIGISRL